MCTCMWVSKVGNAVYFPLLRNQTPLLFCLDTTVVTGILEGRLKPGSLNRCLGHDVVTHPSPWGGYHDWYPSSPLAIDLIHLPSPHQQVCFTVEEETVTL